LASIKSGLADDTVNHVWHLVNLLEEKKVYPIPFMIRLHRNTILLISVAVLLLVSLSLAFVPSRNSSAVDPDIFKVPDQTKIDRVEFISNTDTLELAFLDQRWKVNQQYKADRNLVTALFATIYQATAKREVAPSLTDSINQLIKTQGTRVKLFEQGEVRKEFYVHGNQTTLETWFQLDNQNPYVVVIPGYRVYVASIFQLGEDVWRDKRVFDINWQNFRFSQTVFPASPDLNFALQVSGQNVEVKGLPEADTLRVSNYLDALSVLSSERYLSELKAPWDSLAQTQPYVKITLTDIGGRSHVLEIFPLIPGQRSLLGRNTSGKYLLMNFQDSRMALARRSDFTRPE
jgi:hypothetical protein